MSDRMSSASGWTGEGTILVIDDEESVRRVVARIVGVFGFSAVLADSGAAGLDLLREHGDELRCVLLDLTLPGTSGPEVFDQLRAEAPDLPIVLVTGVDDQEAANRMGGRPVAAYLQKPFTLAAIRETLQRVLG